VAVGGYSAVTDLVLVEQATYIDFSAFNARRIFKSLDSLLEDVLAMLDVCIY